MTKQTRLEVVKDLFKQKIAKAIRKGKLSESVNPSTGNPLYYEHAFYNFLESMNNGPFHKPFTPDVVEKISIESLYNYIIDADPTENKEYSQWLVNQYGLLLDNRYPLKHDDYNPDYETVASRFFEDLGGMSSMIGIHARMKKMKTFRDDLKDINKFKPSEDEPTAINEFMGAMMPYTIISDDSTGGDVVTLTPQQLVSIESGDASMVFDGEEYMVFITHKRESNVIFGNCTNWCTASTNGSWGNAFHSHSKNGPLYVLIRKGHGSPAKILADPMSKLQFHFESEQWMQATDRQIDVPNFFKKNLDIKNYFKTHVGSLIMKNPKYKDNVDAIRKFLTKLGYEDKLIEFLIEIQPEEFTFSSTLIEEENISRLVEIQSIKKLVFSEDTLSGEIPKVVFKLENLEELVISKNPKVNSIPPEIKNLKKLHTFTASHCNIKTICPELGEVESLITLYLNNNQELTKIPDLSNTSVEDISFSNTKITRLPKLPKHQGVTIFTLDITYTEIDDIDPENVLNVDNMTIQNTRITKKRFEQINRVYNADKWNPKGKILHIYK